MTFLPIVARELRVTARRGSTYWLRLAAALAALAVGTWLYLIDYRRQPADLGLSIFVALTIVANLYALLAGVRATADCLSEEKREGTLGLLFLTDLKGYDVVLGKLAATSLNTFYWLLAVFPMMGISLIMGGVTPGEFARVALVSVNNLLFSLAVGMFCSAVSRDDRKAAAGTLLTVLSVTALLPLAGAFVADIARGNSIWPVFLLPCPGYTCFAAFDQTFSRGHGGMFYGSALTVHGMAWICLALACWIVPRSWQERETTRGSLRARWQSWQHGVGTARQARRREMLSINPVLWLTHRERFKSVSAWALLAGLGSVWLWGHLVHGQGWDEVFSVLAAFTAHSILKIWAAGAAAQRLAEDRRSGALELLLATPLAPAVIVRGQRLALWRQFAWPVAAVLVADAFFAMGTNSFFWGRDEWAWIMVWLAGGIMFVWDLIALSWVGPWLGLNSRSPNRAATAAWVRVCVLPWLVFAVVMTAWAVLEEWSHVHMRLGPEIVILGWFIIGGANNLFFAGWARHRLHTQFRETAAERFGTRRAGFWARLSGDGKS